MPGVDDSFRPLLRSFFSPEELDRCVLHFTGLVVRIISLPWLRRRAAAITFGRHVHLRPDYWGTLGFPTQVGLLAHELAHVRQYWHYSPPVFLALYALAYPAYFWRVGQHPLERPAYRMGQEVEALAQQDPPHGL